MTNQATSQASSVPADDTSGDSSAGSAAAPSLLPAQQATLEAIRIPAAERPAYPPEFAAELRELAESELAGLADAARAIESRGLWVSKRDLAGVFGCEARHLAEKQARFEWTVPTARGTVLHKAVELNVHGRYEPADAVADAIERLVADDDNLGVFLAAASRGERKEMQANCTALLTRFAETFPPVPTKWRPAAEVRARVRLCGDAFALSGKYDLTVGAPTSDPDSDQKRAGKVIIDLKTGSRSPTDAEDLRFYALIETLSVGVPPLGIGSFYVSEGCIEHELVTTDVLASALRRTIDGIGRLIGLLGKEREPHRAAGPACRWCPISDGCEPGQAWLSEADD